MSIRQNVINDMLKNISDPKTRNMYGAIVNGNIIAQVRCMSEICAGRIIALITSDGKVEETPPLANKKPTGKEMLVEQKLYKSGLSGHRLRFDGQIGFRCYCGNASVLSAEEKGIIKPSRPTEQDLNTIAKRLQRRTGEAYPTVNGKTEVDGFLIEEVKV